VRADIPRWSATLQAPAAELFPVLAVRQQLQTDDIAIKASHRGHIGHEEDDALDLELHWFRSWPSSLSRAQPILAQFEYFRYDP
jgi:hypothetical protein